MASPDYKSWLLDLKEKIRSTQVKAALAVNAALIQFYWELGRSIHEKQATWGSKFIEQLSKDLKAGFPEMQGFSKVNLLYTVRFFRFYQSTIVQQAVEQLDDAAEVSEIEGNAILSQSFAQFSQPPFEQIPWGHNILIFTTCTNLEEARFFRRSLKVVCPL